MKKLSVLLIFLLSGVSVFASHIVGGEMLYDYIGPGTAAGTNRYRITLRLFRDERCPAPCAAMPPNVFIGIYDNGTNLQFPSANQPYDVVKAEENAIKVGEGPACVVNPPVLDYNYAEYYLQVDLPANAKGYTAAYQTCCRVSPMTNVFNSGRVGDGTGSTYACTIPGTDALGAGGTNSSARFTTSLAPICQAKPFELDFSVSDPNERDSIVYIFCEAYGGGASTNAGNINPAPPPYAGVPYINGYTSGSPLGDKVTIDPKTGIIKGIAPPVGRYVVCVCAYEYRGGKLINIHRKDFLVNVADCDFAGAQLEPAYSFCKSLDASFQNLNNSSLNKSYYWDFGDGNTGEGVAPNHTYAQAGTYQVKLVVNRGDACSDSVTVPVRVYPLFAADFSFAGGCVNRATTFTDRTTTTHGNVATWSWNFGGTSPESRSNLQNPSFTFTTMGQKPVQLIATGSNGCQDTISKVVDITDKPTIDLRFRDTLICKGDRLQLEALGQGQFTWTPSTAIENANTAQPTVFPSVTTQYAVRLDQDGCVNQDTVQVRVVDVVTLVGGADTTICATDSIRLGASTDGLRFIWQPATGLSDPNILNPIATPATTTTYRLEATIGGCTASDEIRIAVAPYPVANAGADALICFENGVRLNGSTDGSRFTWSPANLLQDPTSLSPTTLQLQETQAFVLTAFGDNGCPKPGTDTVLVQVLPTINASAGRDTTVTVGQPLQLRATGGATYLWQPSLALSNPAIADPVAVYDGSQETVRYKVLVANEAGCSDSAFVTVRIFKTDPQIFVPTAFTPNGDNNNDVFRPIAVGMSKIEYFQVFNRWGQMVYQSTDVGRGWDGRVGGQLQPSGTFVWMVKGVDYLGKTFFAKGTVTLIR